MKSTGLQAATVVGALAADWVTNAGADLRNVSPP